MSESAVRERETPRPRLALVTPAISLAATTLIAVLPWGLPAIGRFILPMLPLLAVYYWAVGGRGWLASPLVFAAGLTVDVVTLGPLGFWAFVYLVAHMFSGAVPIMLVETSMRRWIVFGVLIAALSVLQWATASIYFVTLSAWQPYALAAAILVVLYPVFGALFGWHLNTDPV